MEFSERLKSLRLEAGLTQKEIATKFEISQPTYAQWENGRRKPSGETLQKFADFFDVSTDYLLGNSDSRYSDEQLDGMEIFFRNQTQDMTEEERAQFRKELQEYMEERAQAIREWKKQNNFKD